MGKASGTSGRSSVGTSTTATATSVSSKETTIGSMSAAGYADIASRYDLDADDQRQFEHYWGDQLKGIDLAKLDDDMRSALAQYGYHVAGKPRITYSRWTTGAAEIRWRFEDAQGNLVATMERSFKVRQGKRVMGNEFFKVQKEYQNNGMAKHLLGLQLEMAKKAGIDTIAVHANIDVGGYTWARMGFQPRRADLDTELIPYLERRASGRYNGQFYNKATKKTTIRKYTEAEQARAREAVAALRAVYNSSSKGHLRIADIVEKYSDVIRPAWLGTGWHGTINLRDQRNYKDYYNYLHSGKIDGIAGTESHGAIK